MDTIVLLFIIVHRTSRSEGSCYVQIYKSFFPDFYTLTLRANIRYNREECEATTGLPKKGQFTGMMILRFHFLASKSKY